ncbi:transposase, partial [bacterium]|nr:transposase [bacterium]
LSREGEKALKDTVAPFNRRDISDINVGDALVADGNKLDFMIINPYTGKPARAIWVVFFDWYSFDVAGYEIMLTENTQNISSALRNSIIRLGKIPKKVYMDNGRAFRGSYFKGCEDFNQCGFQGVYKNLGIDEVVAKPYNGRSKIVERFFGDFVRSCPPLVASYTGNSITNKPAHLKRNEKFHKELHKNDKIPTIEQAKEIIEAWLNEFHRKRPCPHDKTKSIGEVFESGTGAGVNIEMLDELMMSSCIRTAKRNTIRLFGLEYESTALYGLEDKVVVKYSLFDISKIKIYSLKNEYIGEAKTVVPMKAFVKDGTASDLYRYRMQQKQHNNLLKQTFKKTKTLIGSLRPFEDFSWGQIEELGNIPCLEEKRNRKKLEITIYENAHLYNQQKTKLRI